MIPLRSTLFPLLLAILGLFLVESVLGRQAKENRRDFQKLNDGALDILANLAPKQWESVDEGHLQRMLIPRAGQSSLHSTPSTLPLFRNELPETKRKGESDMG